MTVVFSPAYSAMAATIGGTGLGQIAVVYGYQRFKQDIIWVSVVLIVVIVQIIQEFGMLVARKTDRRIRSEKISKNKNFRKETEK